MSCRGQRLGEGPGRIEFLQLGPVLELWLFWHGGLVPHLLLGLVGLELVQELELVGELGLEVVQWL